MALKITQEDMLEAIKNSQGLITKVQKHLEAIINQKVCWDTVEKYVNKWDATKAAIRAEKEAMLDIAENNIFKDILNGDNATSKWYLKMKGKERGYEETPTIRLDNGEPLNINLSGSGDMTQEELMDAANVELGGDDGSTEENGESSTAD